MQLKLFNQTEDLLTFELRSRKPSKGPKVSVQPRGTAMTTVSSAFLNIRIEKAQMVQSSEKVNTSHATEHDARISNGLFATVPLQLGAKWTSVHASAECPWRIYRSKVSKGHYRLTVLPNRDMSNFLSQMPDSLPLSSLLLPGTHDTMAFHGWPISQCQSPSTPLATQLNSGIRVIDIRLAVVNGKLIAYHGIYPQRTPFQDILSTVHDFLTGASTSREAIVMSIKQEDFNTTPLPTFSKAVHDEIMNGPGGFAMWFLENRIPKLGEVRGKVVMLSRFGGNGSGWEGGLEGLGIHPTAWPDSAKDGFTWTLKGTLVRTQDWYDIPSFLSIPEKTQRASENLLAPADATTPVLNISFFSAASFPFAFPPTIARGFGWPKWGLGIEGVNGRLGKWLLDQLNMGGASDANGALPDKAGSGAGTEDVRIRGWAMMDYYSEPDAVVPLLVECNFRGRKSGEEGWE